MINLKKIRKEKHFTQEQIGELLKVSKSNICHLENGRSMLNQEQIIKLCKALNCSADYLLGLIDEEKEN